MIITGLPHIFRSHPIGPFQQTHTPSEFIRTRPSQKISILNKEDALDVGSPPSSPSFPSLLKMRDHDQPSRVFDDLCALLLSLLRNPHLTFPSSAAAPPAVTASRPPPRRRRPQLSPAGFAALLLGASLAMMLCGSVTFVIGFIMMPWVLGLVMVFYFVGILSSISGLGRTIICASAAPSCSPKTSPKEMTGQIFSRLPFD